MKAGKRWACGEQGPTALGFTPEAQCFGTEAARGPGRHIYKHIYRYFHKETKQAPSLR